MPPLRQRETAAEAQLHIFEAELMDAETYMTLAESLEGFLAKLRETAETLALPDRQRLVRLILKEVQVGPDTLVLRHSIPVPGNHPDPGYPLRGWSHLAAAREPLHESLPEGLPSPGARPALRGAARKLRGRLRGPVSLRGGGGARAESPVVRPDGADAQRGEDPGVRWPA